MSNTVQDAVAVMLHAVGTNFGDHAETVVTAVEVADGETVRALLERLVPTGRPYRTRDYDHFVTLRFVMPAAVHDNLADIAAPTTAPF